MLPKGRLKKWQWISNETLTYSSIPINHLKTVVQMCVRDLCFLSLLCSLLMVSIMLHCSISMFPFFEEDVDAGKWSTYIQQVVGEKLFFFFCTVNYFLLWLRESLALGMKIKQLLLLSCQTLFCSARTGGSGCKLECRKFHLNIKEHFFTVQVTKQCHRLPREIVEYSSLEIFRSHLDMVVGSLL